MNDTEDGSVGLSATERRWRDLEWFDRQYGRGLTPVQASRLAQKPEKEGGLGFSPRRANRYAAAAIKHMQVAARVEQPASKRARSIAYWTDQQQRALARRSVKVTATGFEVWYDDPDFRAANEARMALDKLEGIAPKEEASIPVSGAVELVRAMAEYYYGNQQSPALQKPEEEP